MSLASLVHERTRVLYSPSPCPLPQTGERDKNSLAVLHFFVLIFSSSPPNGGEGRSSN
jgi:hypothetical protein